MLVTHDGLHRAGRTAEKMYIHSDTAKDTAADGRGRKRKRGREGSLTDVSLCHVRYLHYSDIIIPALLYISRRDLCFAARTRGDRTAMRRVPPYRSFFFFSFFFISTIVPLAALPTTPPRRLRAANCAVINYVLTENPRRCARDSRPSIDVALLNSAVSYNRWSRSRLEAYETSACRFSISEGCIKRDDNDMIII